MSQSQPAASAWPANVHGMAFRPFLALLDLVKCACAQDPALRSSLDVIINDLRCAGTAGVSVTSTEMLFHTMNARDEIANAPQTTNAQSAVSNNAPEDTEPGDDRVVVIAEQEKESFTAILALWNAVTAAIIVYTGSKNIENPKPNGIQDFVMPSMAVGGSTIDQYKDMSISKVLDMSIALNDFASPFVLPTIQFGSHSPLSSSPLTLPEARTILGPLSDTSNTSASHLPQKRANPNDTFPTLPIALQLSVSSSNPHPNESIPTLPTTLQLSVYSSSPPSGCWPFSRVLAVILQAKGSIAVRYLFSTLKTWKKDPLVVASQVLYLHLMDTNTHKGRRVCYTMLSDVTPDLALDYTRDQYDQLIISLRDKKLPFHRFRQRKENWEHFYEKPTVSQTAQKKKKK